MLHNYLTTALRNLRRYRAFTLLNIAGLSLGTTCGLLIFLLVRFHLNIDGYHIKASRIFRVVTDLHFGNLIQTPGVPNPFTEALRLDFPALETVTPVQFMHNNLISVEAAGGRPRQKFKCENELGYVEPAFFDVLDYQWISGDKAQLQTPFQAVITRQMATKLFGKNDPLGQTFRVDNQYDYKVAGLLADIPDRTNFRIEVFLSYASFRAITPKDQQTHWGGVSSNQQCFVVLPEGVQPEQIAQGLPAFVRKHHEDHDKWVHHLQPLSDLYFNESYGGEVPKSLIWALAVVGIFLIGTACINFINLATAQALNRSREVGVRKVLGGARIQLFAQFLLETGLIALAAMIVSLALAYWSLPAVRDFTHTKINLHLLSDSGLVLFLVAMTAGVTVLAGAYPAMVLAGFKPALALKGKINTQTLGGYSIRRGLVVTQFVICQVLIIAAVVITRQMKHLETASLGFNKDAVVLLPLPKPEKTQLDALRQQLLQIPGVENASFGFDSPAGDSHNTANCRFDNRQEDEIWYVETRTGDAQYLSTFGIQLVAGRNIQPSDTIREYLLNETAVRKLGLSSAAEAVGKRFQVWGKWAPVVGVVRDFNTQSLRKSIDPAVIMSDNENYSVCGVKISLANTERTLADLERTWNGVYPDDYYSYQFFDEKIARFYEMESALLSMVRVFCGIALFIGCLGLYGLVSFMAARKQKEIGVRKVLGATTGQILSLFGKEFMRLILLAFLLAAPMGWLAMTHWLEDYPYRIPLQAGVFLITLGITLFITLLTVGLQSLRAAGALPANSLRSE